MKKVKEIFKTSKFPFIMSIVCILLGYIPFTIGIGTEIKAKLLIILVSFLPATWFIAIAILSYRFREKEKSKSVSNTITGLLSLFLPIYYFIALIACMLITIFNPNMNPKYYTHYINENSTYLKKVFPKKIPDKVENVKFTYYPGLLQGGTMYSLYYVDKNLSKEKFDKKYKEKAIWIGHKDDYNDESGLLTGVFSSLDNIENKEDFLIYLIDGDCDDSGYCNHGEYLIVAYNEKTNEVLFESENW